MDSTHAKETLKQLLEQIGLEFSDITVAEEADFIRLEIVAPQASKIIGWHGETLNSLQHILKAIVRSQQNLEKNPFIVIDIDGYRRTQEDKVKHITDQKADFVRRTGNRVTLAPMSPYFRRIVHLYVANEQKLQDLTTESRGEGDYRQVVLRMKDEKQQTKVGEELSPVMASDDGLDNLDV